MPNNILRTHDCKRCGVIYFAITKEEIKADEKELEANYQKAKALHEKECSRLDLKGLGWGIDGEVPVSQVKPQTPPASAPISVPIPVSTAPTSTFPLAPAVPKPIVPAVPATPVVAKPPIPVVPASAQPKKP